MNKENYNIILDLCKDKLNTRNLENVKIKRLGGLTNKNYKVDIESGSYVIRLPGDGTEELINRRDEHTCTDLANQVNIDSQLLYFDDNTGIKISSYIVGAETMNAELLREKDNIKSIAGLLKKLHTCGKSIPVIFNVFEKVEEYENLIKKYKHVSLWNDYEEIKNRVYGLKDEVEEMKIQLTMCHCDPLCENFVKGIDRMYLVDWEYAGMNDPMWDVADVFIEAEYTVEYEELFNSFYFGEVPSKELKRRILMNKVFLDFLWSLWGMQRYCCGEDLLEYGNARYARAKKNLKLLTNN
jgi:thiamine kinase-like enzyme